LLTAGFIIKDQATLSSARIKATRNSPNSRTDRDFIDRVLSTYRASSALREAELKSQKEEVIQEFINSKMFDNEFLDRMKPAIQEAFSYVHDYKQFVSQVKQNMNVIIETEQSGKDFEEKLRNSPHQHVAIYRASELMVEKLNTSMYLLYPERITDEESFRRFRLHGLVLKYKRIYESAFDRNGVTVTLHGESYGEIVGNPDALAVIPHTFIDNAYKYSRPGSGVEIRFEEDETMISLSVSCFGPRIEDDEREKIFEPFYRGRNARQIQEEGSGFGLYLSRFIARKYGTDISLVQEKEVTDEIGYLTTFGVEFPRAV
jgi:signal transduction histidine kinase